MRRIAPPTYPPDSHAALHGGTLIRTEGAFAHYAPWPDSRPIYERRCSSDSSVYPAWEVLLVRIRIKARGFIHHLRLPRREGEIGTGGCGGVSLAIIMESFLISKDNLETRRDDTEGST